MRAAYPWHDAAMPDESYPRQKARTRGFQLGRPRSITVLDDGRVLFARSASGTSAVNDLWLLADNEQPVVDVARLPIIGELPAAERARRERLREVTSGITQYSVDEAGRTAVFTVDGTGFAVNLQPPFTGSALDTPTGIMDLRINPAGTAVAFVHDGSLMRMPLNAGVAEVVREPAADTETWGLADFIAAEELGRYRGFWWVGDDLLAAHVDTAMVDTWWIADPAQPAAEPVAHRYPAAGTANARVSLWLLRTDGSAIELNRDHDAWPYVASVHVRHGVVITYLSRDQRTMRIDALDQGSGTATTLRTITDDAWVDLFPGLPAFDPQGALLTIEPHAGVNRLCRDGQPISPETWQVTGLVDATDDVITIDVQPEPTSHAMARLDGTTAELLTPLPGWSGGAARGRTFVSIRTDLRSEATTFTVHHADGTTTPIANLAERPCITPQPSLFTLTERQLPTALLLPNRHGGETLPVIMSPYGGPHAQRVVQSRNAYATEQWIADHGYAVVIVDGAGTPGRGPIEERHVIGDLATPVLTDQVDALQALAADHPFLDLARVGIRGWSFGGYLAALAVLDRPDVFHAAVAGAPVTDWRLYDTAYTERYLGDPNLDAAPYERTDLIPRAAQLARPLLLVHGLADDNVVAAHTLRLSHALLAAGKPHTVLPLSGITHMTPQEIVAENLLRLELDFFDEHLKG
jgi:dipeptidyl-peptidase 4